MADWTSSAIDASTIVFRRPVRFCCGHASNDRAYGVQRSWPMLLLFSVHASTQGCDVRQGNSSRAMSGTFVNVVHVKPTMKENVAKLLSTATGDGMCVGLTMVCGGCVLVSDTPE